MAEQTLEQIKGFYNYVGSKERHGYVSDASAQDDRLILASQGFVQAIQTISARVVLGRLKTDGFLPPDSPPNDKWGLQPGFPDVHICSKDKCFKIFYVNENLRIFWSGTKPLPKSLTKMLMMSEILKVVMSKHTLDELEALHFEKRTETRQVEWSQTIVETTDATIRNQRLTATVKSWRGGPLPQRDWIMGTLNGTWNHLLEIDHPIMGDFCFLVKGTLIHSVVDDGDSNTCAAKDWPDGKLLPRWAKLNFSRQNTVIVNYAADPSMLNLFNELEDFDDINFGILDKLTQWRRDGLADVKNGYARG